MYFYVRHPEVCEFRLIVKSFTTSEPNCYRWILQTRTGSGPAPNRPIHRSHNSSLDRSCLAWRAVVWRYGRFSRPAAPLPRRVVETGVTAGLGLVGPVAQLQQPIVGREFLYGLQAA